LWARYLGIPVEYENSIGMRFRLLPPGLFIMGLTNQERDFLDGYSEFPKGNATVDYSLKNSFGPLVVLLTEPVYFGVTEVTQQQYQEIMDFNPAADQKHPVSGTVESRDPKTLPVFEVSWFQATQFCNALSKREGYTPNYFEDDPTKMPVRVGNGYSLPWESEWEFATKAGATTFFYSGDSAASLAEFEWNLANSVQPVGSKRANPFGYHDLIGNLNEWVNDSWRTTDESGVRSAGRLVNPRRFAEGNGDRIKRGSDWWNSPFTCPPGYRHIVGGGAGGLTGFRVTLKIIGNKFDSK
jgi:formylglycine-generating enzyme required for sulfatase activity